MSKSLLISEIFPPINGGSGRWFWELYTRLPSDEYYLAVGHSEADKEFDSSHNLNITRLDLSSTAWGIKSITGIKFYLKTFWKLRSLIKRNNIKTIHCGRCLPEGVFGLIFKKIYDIPYLCFIHGEDVETASSSRELSWIVKKVLKNAKTLICNSNNSSEILKQNWHISEKKISVIHPGVDTEKFKPAQENKLTKEKLGWADKTIILTVGRLQKRKGQDMMIKALPKIKELIPNVLYAIIGDGQEKSYLKKLSNELNIQDDVLFMSEISDEALVQSYQQCDLFILPNRTEDNDIEGFGMVLVEAQACGKFVIAGDSGGTSETLINERTGQIIDCSNPSNISKLITQKLYHNNLDVDRNDSIALQKKFGWFEQTQKISFIFEKM